MKIDRYLSTGEVIQKSYALNGYDVHATSKRLFVSSFNGNIVQDFVYDHISCLAFNMKRYYWLVAIGIAILALTVIYIFVSRVSPNTPLPWIGIAAGVGCIALGAILKKQQMNMFVVGVGNPVPLYGARSDLDDLFRIIRENQRNSIGGSPASEKDEDGDD